MKRRLYQNYILNSIYQASILIIPLLLTPYVYKVLGVELIGQYSFTRSVVAYYTMFAAAGSNVYAQREIAYRKNDKPNRSIVFWEIVIIRFLLVLFSLIIYIPIAFGNSKYIILWFIQSLDIIAVFVDITWFFQGLEQFGKITVRNIIIRIAVMISVFAFVNSKKDFWIYVLIYSLSNVLGQLWMWFDALKLLDKPCFDKINLKRHVKGIVSLVIPQIAIQIYLVLDKTMIEIITGDSKQTGYYEMAQMFQRIGVSLVTAFGTVTASRVAILKSNSESDEIKKLINQSFQIVILFGIPMAMGLASISSVFIPLYLGNDSAPIISLLRYLCPLIFIIGLSNVSGLQYMVPMGMQNFMTTSTLIGLLANMIMNALLIPQYAARGAVYASVISEFIVLAIQIIYVRSIIQWKEQGIHFLRGVVCGVFMSALLEITKRIWQTQNSFCLVVFMIAAGVVSYMILQFVFGNDLLRQLLQYILRFITPKGVQKCEK